MAKCEYLAFARIAGSWMKINSLAAPGNKKGT